MAEITKNWIADKMRELMKRKPIEKIRVTEICEAADIERPTFYYHFKDKYDLVAWMFTSDAAGTDVLSVRSAADGLSVNMCNRNTEGARRMNYDFIGVHKLVKGVFPFLGFIAELFGKGKKDVERAEVTDYSIDAGTRQATIRLKLDDGSALTAVYSKDSGKYSFS